MADKGREAHNKGEQDYEKCGGQASSNPLTEFCHPSYDPPSGHEDEYKAGWENAKSQDK
ncbi:MAG: hypothetical protein HY446_00795 [Candidatus Niyogibacteria bacterium]|nr:hypothetical protein [Candidatus Niyogibacteria bacterium]